MSAAAGDPLSAETAPDPSEILVVVPTLNERAHIEACLASLIDGDPRMAAVSVIVADGGSADTTREVVANMAKTRPSLSLLDNPGRLQSCAVNLAAARAGEGVRILVRCDAHAVYPPRFVLSVAESLVANGAASLVTPMDAIGEGAFQRAVAFITDTKLGSGGAAHRGGATSGWVDHGHHAGFDLSWFRRIGGYDQSFSHNEDAEYDRRLTEAGGRIWLDAGIRLGVYPRATLTELAKQYWSYGRGRARTLLKHRMRPRLRQIIPVAHVLALGGSLSTAPFHVIGLVWPSVYVALCLGVSLWATTRIGPAGLWTGPALAAMHTVWGAGFLTQAARGQC